MFNTSDKEKQTEQPNLELEKAREAFTEQIRKNVREDLITKRRNLNSNLEKIAIESAQNQRLIVGDSALSDRIDELCKREYDITQLPRLATCLQSKDPAELHEGIIGLRKILSNSDNPPIQAVIDANLVPRMIDLIKQSQYPYLQMEATWALTNIASGSATQCQSIVDKGGIPIFIKLLSSHMETTVEQAVWALANIAGDTHFNRDMIIKLGGLSELIKVVETTQNPNIFRQGGWAIANLCRGTPRPNYESVKESVAALAKILKDRDVTEEDILIDVCWALSFLSDGSKTRIERVVETGAVDRLVELLGDPRYNVLVPALRTLGNIATGNEKHTEALLRANVMPYFENLLSHSKTIIRRETVWAISNIAAGVRSQVIEIVSRTQLVAKLLELFEADHVDVKKQIAWTFSNMYNSAEPIMYCTFIKQCQLMRYFVALLGDKDDKAVDVGLQGIRNFLLVGDKIKGAAENPMILELSNFKGIEKLQELQYHKSTSIYKKVYSILETFFMPKDTL